MKPLQIFKPGKHVARDGRVFTFTEADVKATAAAYDPALHESPLVVGHPEHNSPAYGWAKSLSFSDGVLQALPDQVNPEFAELVKGGTFKKISASFYAPDAPENPKPGVYYLRHIGFLGGKAPAVKGLKNAEFAADEKGVIEFMDWTTRDIASVLRSLRDFFIEQFGLEKADKAIPGYMVESVQADAIRDTTPNDAGLGVSYSERNDDVETKEQKEARERAERELKAKQDEQARKEVEFAEREKKLKEGETAQRRVAIVAEVDALVAAGKILPKDKAGLVAFMETLPTESTIEFGEGDKKEKKPSIDWLRGFLKTLPKAVEFSARVARGEERVDETNPAKAAQQMAARAIEYQEAEAQRGRHVSIDMAVQHVTREAQ